jgi:hypothetical protein
METSTLIEIIGWLSTALFLLSILLKSRFNMHALGILTSVLTGVYAYYHGATAIWVKWVIAFVFHFYMLKKYSNK